MLLTLYYSPAQTAHYTEATDPLFTQHEPELHKPAGYHDTIICS